MKTAAGSGFFLFSAEDGQRSVFHAYTGILTGKRIADAKRESICESNTRRLIFETLNVYIPAFLTERKYGTDVTGCIFGQVFGKTKRVIGNNLNIKILSHEKTVSALFCNV